ncbi:VCBS repeat-containing protein [Aquiflexum sp.]|uniref:VCBS repeat-containing protein n=1 Tax=Aquiflexum sp. TaxID=1872584 RepID=UPI003593BB8E
MRLSLPYFLIVPLLVLTSCQKKETLFEQLSPQQTGISFSNDIFTNDTLNALNYDYIYNGAGVAVGDINNDGLPDLFFGGNMVSSKLYLNKGNLEFEDITLIAGLETDFWVTGTSMVDINGNGLLDIYLSVASKDPAKSKNRLYINQGDLTFKEMGAEFGLDDDGYSTHAAFFDYDGDGDLDVYILTNAYENANRNTVRAKKTDGESRSTDRLYRNNGDGTFTDVSREAGILKEGYGLGVAISDINRDGWPDIYVANDFITNDLIWINNGDGTFTDKASEYLKHQSFNGMGVDVADFNNDGWVDIAVMDMLPPDNLRQKTMFPDINYNQFKMILGLGYSPQYVRNTLQFNNGNNTFSEIAYLAGVHETDWSWAPLFADYNNSGYKDLFITNGYRKDVTNLDFIVYNRDQNMFGTKEANVQLAMEKLDKLPGAHIHNFMFKNNGGLVFEEVSEQWGFGTPTFSNGAAFVDLDNDGDLDLVINNIDSKAGIFKNRSESQKENHFLQFELKGTAPNTMALGTKITITTPTGIQFYENHLYRGYKSTVSDIVHFGLGQNTEAEEVEITWPDGRQTILRDVKSNQRLILSQKDAVKDRIKTEELPRTLLTEITGEMGLEHRHEETDYADFYDQFLLPHKFSKNGPGIAVGDINGDGLEDFYVGGAAGFHGRVFIQTPTGFESFEFPFHPESEDMGALLFDVNGNGHLDLYVVSGGSSFPEGSIAYQDRLYLNDGKGNFRWDEKALPSMVQSGSKVAAVDFDGDGFLDLFVGGRVVPGQYPYPARSYLLKNENGKFKDVTETMAPDLAKMGLVTDGIWTDFDNDGKIDLIVVGEWMPITFFKNTGGEFINVTGDTGLENSEGWWNSIAAGDFNGDGMMDYILGNLGLNSRLKVTPEKPVKLYAADFDNNKSVDPILTRYIQGMEYPVHPRDNLISQIPSMKRRLPKYELYGQSDIEKVLSKEERRYAYQLKAAFLESAFLENQGNGKFILKPLPVEVQISPIFGTVVQDFDGDGHQDVLLTGNSYASEIQSGWYDAGIGALLLGDGAGNFTPVHHTLSGFFVDTDAKGMAKIHTQNNQSIILVASNDGELKSFSTKSPGSADVFSPEALDSKVVIQLENGHQTTHELYHGTSYLSHSSRKIPIPENATQVTIFNSKGESRKMKLFSRK